MKKFLSLVLALVMTMSLVTISAGAEDFADDSKITYEEAVDVMSAIGVVGGYADGSFNPQGGLTRGAAAKIICNMILGPTTAEALSANDAPYKDVPADHTFAGYIAYCANEGIISGYADGTFRPAAPLTGYAFMKMLLGALGYDTDIEGYTGANWSIQVAKRALNIGLDDGLEGTFVGAKSLTREEACLYAFNTLKADMVKYDSKSTITVGDIVISQNSDAEVDTDTAGLTQLPDAIASRNAVQFAEKYFEDLTAVVVSAREAVTDDFGRPAHTWKWDGDKIGTYVDTADYVVVLDDDYTSDWKGMIDYIWETTDNDDLGAEGATVKYNGDDAVGADYVTYAVPGAVLELFCNNSENDDLVTTIVAYNYVLDEIEEVSDDVSKAAAKKDATYSIELKTAGVRYDEYKNSPANELPGFDAETYVEDAKVALCKKADGTIIDSYIPEIVTGEVDSYKTAEYVYVDGTKYGFNGNISGVTTNFSFDDEYELYMDANGLVLGIEGVTTAALDDVYYVAGVYQTKSAMGTVRYYAQTVALDGTVAELQLEKSEFESGGTFYEKATSTNALETSVAGLYALTDKAEGNDKAGNDKFNASSKLTGDINTTYTIKATGTLAESLAKDDSKMTVGGTKIYLTDETNYVGIEKSADDIDVATAVGGMKYAQKSGVTETVYVISDKDDSKTAVYVLIVSSDLSGAVASDDVVYVAKTSGRVDADGYINTLYFMADNTEAEVTVDTNNVAFYTYDINDDGVYELSGSGVTAINEKVDEDVTGYASMTITNENIYKNLLTYGSNFVDVSFEGAKVIDVRTDDAIEGDVYDREITSVSTLKSAAKLGAVAMDLYVIDGEITFICVTNVQNAQVAQ